MRKMAIFILILAVFFIVIGCAKSEAAQAVDDQIIAIGPATLDNEKSISDAEKAVAGLSEKDQKKLENIAILKDARLEIDTLLAGDVAELITSIGSVTSRSEEKVAKARLAYDSLGDQAKSLVSNYNLLEDAERTLFDGKVREVEEWIGSLGNVTLDSGPSIRKARAEYDQAEEVVQKSVSNYEELTKAEQTFINLTAKDIEDSIKAIGSVSLESKDLIKKARKSVDSSHEDVQKLVKNLDDLVKAEEKLSELNIANTTSLISAIGTVTLDSGVAISHANDAYKELSAVEKSKIANNSVLATAIKEFQALKEAAEKAEKAEILSRLRVTEDRVQNITFYHSQQYPEYIDLRSFLLPYIGLDNGKPYIRVTMNYTGESWIFFEEVYIVIDGKRHYKEFNYFDLIRDNQYGGVWEVADYAATGTDLAMLQAIADSQETIVRFQGRERNYDLIVSDADKAAIKETLRAYELLR